MIINHTITGDQIKWMYENQNNKIHSSITEAGDTWKGQIYPNDGNSDGDAKDASLIVL